MADYKTDILTESKIEWIAASGHKVEIVCRLKEAMVDHFGLGDYKRDTRGLSVSLDCYVNDKEQMHTGLKPSPKNDRGFVAILGQIGLTAERKVLLDAAKAEVESHPTWQAHLAATRKGESVRAAHDAYERRLDNIMTLNGRSK